MSQLVALVSAYFFALTRMASYRIILALSLLFCLNLEFLSPQGTEPLSRQTAVLALVISRFGMVAVIALCFCGMLRSQRRAKQDTWLRSLPVSPWTLVLARFIAGLFALAVYLIVALTPSLSMSLIGGVPLKIWGLALFGELFRGAVLLAFATLFAPYFPRLVGTAVVTALFFLGHLSFWMDQTSGAAAQHSAMIRLLLGLLPKFEHFSTPLLAQLTGSSLPSVETVALTCVYCIGYVLTCLIIATSVEFHYDAA